MNRTTLPIVALIGLFLMTLSGCGSETKAGQSDVTAIKLAMMQFAGANPSPDTPDVECLCGGTGRSGDGIGPCACDPDCSCKANDDAGGELPPAPEPPVDPDEASVQDQPDGERAPEPPFDGEPAQTLEAPADLPVVTCYVTRNCSACDDVKRWHTDDLPFRLVFVMDDRLEPHPWFEWEVNGVRLRWPHKGRLDQSIDRDYVVRVWEHSHTPGVVSAPAKTEDRPTAQPSRRMQYAAPNYTRPVYSYQPAQWFTGRFRSSQACRTCR